MIEIEKQFPITTIQYPNGQTLTGIQLGHIKENMTPKQYEKFSDWMQGQTMSMDVGVYVYDLETFMNVVWKD